MRPLNGTKPDAQELIDRILADERFRASSHFSDRVYTDEPILITGNRMASYLPERYRKMREISRWEPEGPAGRGRWLSEAELFYRQGIFMADYEDDCPYHGNFKSYFPTYNAMSDRQLRGYFTWRSAVRRGTVQETSLSFAYVYLYELINGIGVANPREGFDAFESFCQAYRAFAPEIDRFAGVWLQDYVVYHDLPVELLEPYKTLAFDRAIIALRRADDRSRELTRLIKNERKKRGASAMPLPCDKALESELFDAIDALSTYKLSGSRLYRDNPDGLRHVACAVFVRTSDYYRRQRKNTLLESWFGEEVALPYTMFGSAVFFSPRRHVDTVYQLDEIHRYRCQNGIWTCERIHGSRSCSPKLGICMRAVDRSLRTALGYEHPLKETKPLPKYLEKFIDEEVAAWMSWHAAHAPRHITIDLSQLADIRRAAVSTRESLLIDEEREGTGTIVSSCGSADEGRPSNALAEPQSPVTAPQEDGIERARTPIEPPVPPAPVPRVHAARPLTPGQESYLRSLAEGDAPGARDALQVLGTSEDMAVDAINDALFDLIGDTTIEYGASGPELIEDYREDVEGFLAHD